MSEMKTASVAEVKKIMREANAHGYNRQLREDLPLDPNGTSILVHAMIHEHAAGVEVDPHVRAAAYLKLDGQDDPAFAYIDIPMPVWDTLTSFIPHPGV